jgi:hypothetical protein
MKQKLLCLFTVTSLFIISCNNNDLPPVVPPVNYYANPYAGNYKGIFYEENNGVDSNGVFKDSSAYEYTLNVRDEGNDTIGFSKGDLKFDNIVVNDTGGFIGFYIVGVPMVDNFGNPLLDSLGNPMIDSLGNPIIKQDTTQVNGYFSSDDSVHVDYHALSGSYNFPQWFVITRMTFVGKKVF